MRFAALLVILSGAASCDVELPRGIRFHAGPVNAVTIGRTAIYGVPQDMRAPKRLLITHARRDLFPVSRRGASKLPLVVPEAERELFENPSRFWSSLETDRFHDYAQLGTKVPVEPVRVARAVSDGDSLTENGSHILVIGTPGYTRGAVSYLIMRGGKRIACTGDLIHGDGQLFDLYSLQDAVPEAKARGYHGYAARAVDLIASLRKIAAAKPDILLPARGPAIADPAGSIQRLIDRLQEFLASHFEVDALRWYWGDENHRIRSRAVERAMNIMPMAEQSKLPDDIVPIGNSRLIVSRTGSAFLVDAGYSKLLPELRRLRDSGKIRGVDGIWITHYHDDHTDYAEDVASEFGAPVYFAEGMREVLANPGSFRLPCLTTRPLPVAGSKKDGETLQWHEWRLTFQHFPGQTLYHGGLIAQHEDGRTFLFTGDSFTPSGMDDYCMQNRVFLRKGEGYEYCLRKIGELPKNSWLINQHVEPVFRYSQSQVSRMRAELERRSKALEALSPWPEINYMLDESWARIHPYGSAVTSGETVELELWIQNHSPGRETYLVKWNVPSGWTAVLAEESLSLEGRQSGAVRARLRAGDPGLQVVTADVSFSGRELPQWTEALVRVR